jgi:TctA family transporter
MGLAASPYQEIARSVILCTAVPGYDFVPGLGSAQANLLILSLVVADAGIISARLTYRSLGYLVRFRSKRRQGYRWAGLLSFEKPLTGC